MVVVRVFIVVFLSFLTIGQVSANLGALGVLEVLRQDFEAVPSGVDNYPHQQRIATAAIELIVTTRLSLPFERNYRKLGYLKDDDGFSGIPNFATSIYCFYSQMIALQGTRHYLANSFLESYQSFGFSSTAATLTQKTRYVEWFLRAALVKVDVDDILAKAASTPEVTGSFQGLNHLAACRQLWALTEKTKNEKNEKPDYHLPFFLFSRHHLQAPTSNIYFNTLDAKITGGGDFRDFYQKRVTDNPYADFYDRWGKSPKAERLEKEKKEREEKARKEQAREEERQRQIRADREREERRLRERREDQEREDRRLREIREEQAREDERQRVRREARQKAETELSTFMPKWLAQFPAGGGGPLKIVFEYLSKTQRDELLPCIPLIQRIRTMGDSFLDRVIPGGFLPVAAGTPSGIGGAEEEVKETPTLSLTDRVKRVLGASGTILYLQLDLRAVIPVEELWTHPSLQDLVVFRNIHFQGGGSWIGDSRQIDLYADTPGSFSMHLDNGTRIDIQRSIDEGGLNEFTLTPNREPGKRPPKPKIVSLQPRSEIHFSEDQRHLYHFTKGGKVAVLDTLTCVERPLDRFFTQDAYTHIQQVLISADYIVVRTSQNINLYEAPRYTPRGDTPGEFRLTRPISNFVALAFSPSQESLFGIGPFIIPGQDWTPGQYVLQEIDLVTLAPRLIPGVFPITLTGTRDEIANGGYLNSIGEMLLYFRHDGQVMRWKVAGY